MYCLLLLKFGGREVEKDPEVCAVGNGFRQRPASEGPMFSAERWGWAGQVKSTEMEIFDFLYEASLISF